MRLMFTVVSTACSIVRVTLSDSDWPTSELYRVIGLYANQLANIADPVKPIEQATVERQIESTLWMQ